MSVITQSSLHDSDQTTNYIPPGVSGLMFDTCGDIDPSQLTCRSVSSSYFQVFGNKKSVVVNRPVYTQQEFDSQHGTTVKEAKAVWQLALDKVKTLCRPKQCANKKVWRKQLNQTVPCVDTIVKYNPKEYLLSDVICGLTVGVMHIPQGMAYSMLATLPPVNGLYTSFFPVLVYFFFGTSRHLSIGTIAIVSLLTGSFLDRAINDLKASRPALGNGSDSLNATFGWNHTNSGNSTDILSPEDFFKSERVKYAAALAFVVGLIQLGMGIFRLGFLTRYLSDSLIAGYTIGASVHVFTSQIKNVFGLTLKKNTGMFNIPKTYVAIFSDLPKTNLPTLGIAGVSIVLLYVVKEYANPFIRKKIKAPIPIELLIVISGTLVSHFMELQPKYGVKVVGTIPDGIPPPLLPDVSIMSKYISDCISITIIAFSVCISLAKLFAKKHDYNINPSQELIAYGLSNFVSSFFRCYPSSSSLSRSALQDSMNGKTQLVGLVSCALLIIVLLFIGPMFKSVPTCCLAAIILVALKGMFMQIKEFPALWRLSKWDGMTYIVAAVTTVILDVDLGLAIGVAFSLMTIIFRTQSPSSHMLGRIKKTDIYKNIAAYSDSEPINGIKIFRYEGSVYFACADHFRRALYTKTNCNPQKIHISWKSLESKLKKLEQKIELLREREGLVRAVIFDNLDAQSTEAETPRGQTEGEGVADSSPVQLRVETTEPEMTGALRDLLEKQAILQERLNKAMDLGLHHVVIDASTWGYIDQGGILALIQVIQEYKEIGISVFLANPKTEIREMLNRSDFYEKNDHSIIYVSVHDAVLEAIYEYEVRQNVERIEAIPESGLPLSSIEEQTHM